MSQNKRLVKNTFYLYVRMVALMLVSLYTSRVLLSFLGEEDLGIYNVVASVVLMLEFVSSSLTNSSQRYLSIGLGRNDIGLSRRYFSQSLSIHLLLSILMVIVLETVGTWVLTHKLVIPPERKNAAYFVFQMSVITAFLKINLICFQSVIISRENMSLYGYLSVFEGVMKLIIVYLIAMNNGIDRLVLYSLLLVGVQLIIFMVHFIYCKVKYDETQLKLIWDKKLSKEMMSFTGINIFGSLSWSVGVQGLNILLNLFFGPVVNASRALASTVGRLFNQIVSNIYTAIKPQLIKSYARQEIEKMVSLAEKSTIYVYYIVLIICLPLFAETPVVLRLWLKDVPEYTNEFTKMVIVQSLIWMLPISYSQIATATGDIKKIQLYGRIFTLMALPISYGVLKAFRNPLYAIYVVIIMDSCYWLYTVVAVNQQLNLKFSRYFSNVIRPILLVTLVVGFIVYCSEKFLLLGYSGILRLSVSLLISLLSSIACIYSFGMPREDIQLLKKFVVGKISRKKLSYN